MIVEKHGQTFSYNCPRCGCMFRVGTKDTCIEYAGVGGNDACYHDCPDCGASVLGNRTKWLEKKKKEGGEET